jgi:hypothetical protein
MTQRANYLILFIRILDTTSKAESFLGGMMHALETGGEDNGRRPSNHSAMAKPELFLLKRLVLEARIDKARAFKEANKGKNKVSQAPQLVKVPCSGAIYGCTEMVPYYQKEEHENVCPHHWGCFCPVPICTSFGPPEALLEHLTTKHQLPSTTLPDPGTVPLHLQQGLHKIS